MTRPRQPSTFSVGVALSRVVVVDFSMPGMDGLQALELIPQLQPHVIVTDIDDARDVVAGENA